MLITKTATHVNKNGLLDELKACLKGKVHQNSIENSLLLVWFAAAVWFGLGVGFSVCLFDWFGSFCLSVFLLLLFLF